MKSLFILLFFSLLVSQSNAQTVYDYSVHTLGGQQHSLREYPGKRLLIVILPATRQADDSAFLKHLDSVAVTYTSKLQVIGVPSYEDGYTEGDAGSLHAFYKTLLNKNILLAKGMHTRKGSANQEGLMNWLTHVAGNKHFDKDIKGPGQQFFINEKGELYGVFGPEVKFSHKLLQYMLP
jgi:glutathione peroxidase-family protein